MGKLILIRHARPEVNPKVAARNWMLSPEGRAEAGKVVDTLSETEIRRIFTSDEPKAIETGEIIALHLGLEAEIRADLHEHEREGVGFLAQSEFEQAIESLFSNQSERVFGNESGDEATGRFTDAIEAIEKQIDDPNASYACVTHGTVMALFVSSVSNHDGHKLWRQFGLPATITLDRATYEVLDIVNHY